MSSGNRTDISLDDPNFWDKWAKKADIDMDMVNGRVRTINTNDTVYRIRIIRTLHKKMLQLAKKYLIQIIFAEILLALPFPSLQNSLVIDTPRVRKQTRPFSATKDELAELSEGESDKWRNQTEAPAKPWPTQQLRAHRVFQSREEPACIWVRRFKRGCK